MAWFVILLESVNFQFVYFLRVFCTDILEGMCVVRCTTK